MTVRRARRGDKLLYRLTLIGIVLAGVFATFAWWVAGASATGCQNEELRANLGSQLLPDCRAYELVTPAYKEGGRIHAFAISEDGSHVLVGGFGVFDSVEGDPLDPTFEGAAYMLSRTSSGWSDSPIEPPESVYQRGLILFDVSSDFTKSLWALGTREQPENLTELYLRTEDGSFEKIGPASVGERRMQTSNIALCTRMLAPRTVSRMWFLKSAK